MKEIATSCTILLELLRKMSVLSTILNAKNIRKECVIGSSGTKSPNNLIISYFSYS